MRDALRLAAAFVRRDVAARRDARGGPVRWALGFVVVLAGLWHLALLVPDESLRRAGAEGAYLPFTLVGMAALALCSAASGAPRISVVGERHRGTLEFLLLSPAPPAVWILGGAAVPLLAGLVYALAWLALAFALAPVSIVGVAAAFGLALLGAAAAFAWGLASTALHLRGFTLAGGPALQALLGGVLFPVGLFPAPVRLLSYCLPVTHAAAGARAALAGSAETALHHAVALTALALLGTVLGGGLLARTFRRMRATGDFG